MTAARTRRRPLRVGEAARRLLLLALGLLWLVPLYLLVANAMRPATSYDPATEWHLPTSFALLSNFRQVLQRTDLGGSILSSLLYSLSAPTIAVLIGALAGFAIVVLRLRRGFLWFVVIFGGTVVPGQMLIVPLFVGFSNANLYDTRQGLILAYVAICVPLAAFMMRNFFTGIAYSLYEAAILDGASTWKVFWRIYLPLSLTALAAIFILEFTVIWNELLLGLTLTQTASVRPIMASLTTLQSAYSGTTVPVILAAGLLVSLPTVAVFLATQRLFARGLSLGQL